jgi:hypothetical protein
MIINGKLPQLAMIVRVNEVFFHCGKSMIRSGMWEPGRWGPVDGLPTYAQALKKHGAMPDALEDLQARVERNETHKLYWDSPAIPLASSSPASRPPPTGSNWIHEIKHDGYLLIAAAGNAGAKSPRCFRAHLRDQACSPRSAPWKQEKPLAAFPGNGIPPRRDS